MQTWCVFVSRFLLDFSELQRRDPSVRRERLCGNAEDSFQGLPAPDALRDNPYFVEGDFGPSDGPEENSAAFRELLASFGLENTVLVARLGCPCKQTCAEGNHGQRSEDVAFRRSSIACGLPAAPRRIGFLAFSKFESSFAAEASLCAH